ncbi:ribosome maturation factor RimP [Leeia sp. TBRC 13508]|uniref:Ribosome maturation factor RimP n=1 Tax=Leeia speluncae TaxID=2884804 RepID=A0ABS8D1D8_9NEIS|nr:ribosome maturation factor RimP [Leeia speluncae]MCB6182007.1 ribosome maturation factor RimP [Leeia speluncae]
MDVRQLIESTLSGMGYELVDMQATPRGGMQLFIDRLDHSSGGVTIDDCVKVSNHLSNLFLVENVSYERLEVSSPGLDRLLNKPTDFERFAGKKIKVKLRVAVENHKKVVGYLQGLKDDVLTVTVDGKDWNLPMQQVDKVRLEPDF